VTGSAPNHDTVTPTLQHVARTCSYDWISAQVFSTDTMVGGHTRHVAENQIHLLYTLFCSATLLVAKGASTVLYILY
jgi:hypothetical protein